MAGLYIHIPFCRRKCHYCNFYSLASSRHFDHLIEALKDEIDLRKHEVDEPLETIYFGGGTPSMLNDQQLEGIMDRIYKNFSLTEKAEITLEANPEDITREKLISLKKNHINRLSIGIQSFYDNELTYLNRIHSARKAIDSVRLSQDMGFENISIDLIYGLPNATIESWKNNLRQAFRLEVPHLSCYTLTVEPNTALAKFIEKGRMKNVSEALFEEQFEILIQKTAEMGYQQYEISNFCKDAYYAAHNTSYWFGKKYLGVGPSAHSYDGQKRQWNVAHIKNYINSVNNGKVLSESEAITPLTRYNEYIMTRLRTQWGVSISDVNERFGKKAASHFTAAISKYLKSGHLQSLDDTILLTKKGKFISDGIIAELFIEEA